MENKSNRIEANNNVRFFPIFLVATILALEEAIESQIDEMVIGNVFDDVAFGAINLIEPYMTIVNFVSYLLCVGGAALIVRAHGQNDIKKMGRIFNHCVSCCICAGLMFFGVYMTFREQLVELVAGGTEQFLYSKQVFFWQCFYAMLFPLCVFLQTYVLYRGAYWLVGMTTFCCIVGNPILSLILGKAVGVGGIMLATVIINIVEILIMMTFLMSKRHGIRYRFTLSFALAKQIFTLGLGESSVFLSVAFLELSVNAIAVNFYHTPGLVVMSIIINLLEISMFVSEGISEFETVALNESIGRNDQQMMQKTVRTTMMAAILEGACFTLFFLTAAEPMVAFFDVDDVTTVETAVTAIHILAMVPIVVCLTRILAIFYQYTGRIKRTILLFGSAWGMLPALCGFALGMVSLEGLVFGMILGNIIALAAMCLYATKIRKEKVGLGIADN